MRQHSPIPAHLLSKPPSELAKVFADLQADGMDLKSEAASKTLFNWLGQLVPGSACPECGRPMKRFEKLNGMCWPCGKDGV